MPESNPVRSIESGHAFSGWGIELHAAICEVCDWSYLLPHGRQSRPCPHCFQSQLTPLPDFSYSQPPELFLPFTAATDQVAQTIQNFAGSIWFAPSDLQAAHLSTRLQQIYLPMWLVDSDVEAMWQAEAGFNYQVVSHQDAYDQNRNGWASRQVTETRVRWEPRLGRLRRAYHNIAAPALEEHRRLQQKLGRYDLGGAQPFSGETITSTAIRLPNRTPADAWPEAMPSVRTAAAAECRRACEADHIREFRWSADYANQNWSLLLLPLYTTYYLDDNRAVQPIHIHGQTGRLHGPRRASMRRAQRVALMILAAAVVLFMLSLIILVAGMLAPPLLALGVVGLILAGGIGLLAIAPVGMAWHFNRPTT